MDYRLTRWIDDNGQLWQVCMICTDPTREQDLAIDPTDGLRWDVCAECKRKEKRMSYPPYPPQQPNPPQPHPQHSVTQYRKRTNHTFHLIVSLCTCFMWFPVWMCVWAWNAWGPKATAHTHHQ